MKHIINNLVKWELSGDEFDVSPRDFDIEFIDDDRPFTKRNRYSIFSFDETITANVEVGYNVKKVQGPYATLSLRDIVLTAHKQTPPTILKASIEDTFVIGGVEYISFPQPNGNRSLSPVTL